MGVQLRWQNFDTKIRQETKTSGEQLTPCLEITFDTLDCMKDLFVTFLELIP